MKEAFDVAIGKADLVFLDKSPFSKALELAQECAHLSDPSSNTPDALEATAREWRKARASVRAKVNEVTRRAFLEVKLKFEKVSLSTFIWYNFNISASLINTFLRMTVLCNTSPWQRTLSSAGQIGG